MKLIYREAQVADIAQMSEVRLSVKENVLPDPTLIPASEYEDYITSRGKGWVCEAANRIVGFAVADLQQHNIWALFVQPEWEGRGIGKTLHHLMLQWYFLQTQQTVWLGTAPRSRAESFYRKSGWNQTGVRPNGEIRFEMTYHNYLQHQATTF
jgi:GNAT superfamily N-acetyltransferase